MKSAQRFLLFIAPAALLPIVLAQSPTFPPPLEAQVKELRLRVERLEQVLAELASGAAVKTQSAEKPEGQAPPDLAQQAERLYEAEQYPEAVRTYSVLLLADPSNYRARMRRAFSYRQIGRTQEAIRDYTEAIRLKSTDAMAYNNRGEILSALGRHTEAANDFREAVRLSPTTSLYQTNSEAAEKQLSGTATAAKPAGSTSTGPTPITDAPSVGATPTGKPIYVGPRGGRYHYSSSGRKVYERRR